MSSLRNVVELCLNLVVILLTKVIDYFYPCPGFVNGVDCWWYNRKLSQRAWRIPQLCHKVGLKHGKLAEMKLFGQRIVIVTDHHIASQVMGKCGKYLRQRFGNDKGLDHLNMNKAGLIWNNNVSAWKKNRLIFESTLSDGVKQLDEITETYFKEKAKSIEIANPTSLLTLVRDYTISATMQGLFGLQTSIEWRNNAKRVVSNYFRAWEFFLLTPDTSRFSEEKEHDDACHEMRKLSDEIFVMAEAASGSNFIDSLKRVNNHNEVIQNIGEMLLAGTDTSSLSMYYTLLFLADHPDVANQISSLGNPEATIVHVYYEGMRLVPVGPVILRQAEVEFQESGVHLRVGDGVIFNIAGMNRSSYSNPNKFNPGRFDVEPVPLSFGTGKKSCVGKNFGEKEMKFFLTWLVKNYSVLGTRRRVVDLLETRWDVANSPVEDIKLALFPRKSFHFIGPGRTAVAEGFRELYPLINISADIELKVMKQTGLCAEDLEDDKVYGKLYSKCIQIYLAKSTQENGFAIINGCAIDSMVKLNSRNTKYEVDDGLLQKKLKGGKLIYFPVADGNQKYGDDVEAYLKLLQNSGLEYHEVNASNLLEQITEVVKIIDTERP